MPPNVFGLRAVGGVAGHRILIRRRLRADNGNRFMPQGAGQRPSSGGRRGGTGKGKPRKLLLTGRSGQQPLAERMASCVQV